MSQKNNKCKYLNPYLGMHIWKHLHAGKFNIKMDDVEISENMEEHTGNYTLSIVLTITTTVIQLFNYIYDFLLI